MVEFLSLQKITAAHEAELQAAVNRVVQSGWYLLGEEVAAFERAYAAYIGTQFAVGCGNGLDALTLLLRGYIELGVMQPGDEIIVPAHTYIATILAITESGLVARPVEPRLDTLEMDPALVEAAVTPRTRAVMLVHLYGRCSWTPDIQSVCERYGLKLLEDNAQAHGCRCLAREGRHTGALGDAAAHSFYPGKNLGAFGDGGAVTTDDEALATVVRALGNYGSPRKYVFDYRGRNSRLDELQAAVLRVKLQYLDEENERRRKVAERYYAELSPQVVHLPERMADAENVYHLFPVLSAQRDALQTQLKERGVATIVHYPIPPHRQRCYAEWGQQWTLPRTEQLAAEELSLPISPVLTDEEVSEVIRAVNEFR
jgi:dTDP-4-amino-4,6-dideoxygalactose transaminase